MASISSHFSISSVRTLSKPQIKCSHSHLVVQFHRRNNLSSTNFCPKNPNFSVKRFSSMNGYPMNHQDLEMEAKETARSWVRSGTAIIEILQMFHIPTLMAIAILSRIAIASGGTPAILLAELSVQLISISFYLGFLWKVLPPEKLNLFKAPQDFLGAVMKRLQDFFAKLRGMEECGLATSMLEECGLATSMLEECGVVLYKLKRIGGGHVDEVQMLKKKHPWINAVAFLFACAVLDCISAGVTKV